MICISLIGAGPLSASAPVSHTVAIPPNGSYTCPTNGVISAGGADRLYEIDYRPGIYEIRATSGTLFLRQNDFVRLVEGTDQMTLQVGDVSTEIHMRNDGGFISLSLSHEPSPFGEGSNGTASSSIGASSNDAIFAASDDGPTTITTTSVDQSSITRSTIPGYTYSYSGYVRCRSRDCMFRSCFGDYTSVSIGYSGFGISRRIAGDSCSTTSGTGQGGRIYYNSFSGKFITPVPNDTTPPDLWNFIHSPEGSSSDGSIHFNLEFSEPVIGLTADDFQIANISQGLFAFDTKVSGFGKKWTVRIRTAGESGSFDLDYNPTEAISDNQGNRRRDQVLSITVDVENPGAVLPRAGIIFY